MATFQRLYCNGYIPTALFQRLYCNDYIFNCYTTTVIFCGLYMYGWSPRVPPPSLPPIVLSSLLEMSRRYPRYLRHVQGSSSDDENEEVTITTLHVAQAQHEHMSTLHWGGSMPGRDYVHRDREAAHQTLYSDYFSQNSTYGPTFFRRRFAISP
jgi:hypothetical protein